MNHLPDRWFILLQAVSQNLTELYRGLEAVFGVFKELRVKLHAVLLQKQHHRAAALEEAAFFLPAPE